MTSNTVRAAGYPAEAANRVGVCGAACEGRGDMRFPDRGRRSKLNIAWRDLEHPHHHVVRGVTSIGLVSRGVAVRNVPSLTRHLPDSRKSIP